MNKREAEKLAREITWRVCMMNEFPSGSNELAQMVEALQGRGWKLERKSMAGMDGIAVYMGEGDMESDFYIASPRKRNPGRKQTCTAYTMADMSAYALACEALAANEYAEASRMLDGIKATSLRNDVEEGMRRLEEEMGWEEISRQMEPEPSPMGDLESIRLLVSTLGEFEVSQKRPGCCIWVKGDTKPHREELKSFGLKWAPKKQAWYWKPQAA